MKIYYVVNNASWLMKKRKKPNKIWVKHILRENSRMHVISYDTNGSHCNVENCEINKEQNAKANS